MNTILAVLDPHPDGSVHLPLPPELLGGRVRIEARLEAADALAPGGGALSSPAILRQRKEALEALRALGGLGDIVPDPVQWQREQRQDRSLPGRD